MEHTTRLKFYVMAFIDWVVLAVPWIAMIDVVSKIISVIIAILLAILARRKYSQDMRNAKMEEEKKRLEIENLQQKQYQHLRRNKRIR